jgi:hypothetical protein
MEFDQSHSAHRMQAYELSYREMTADASGRILSDEAKADIRKQQGYCLTCPLIPVKLIQFHRSRLNPLWITKKLLAVPGESMDGKCLKCNPDLDPQRQQRLVLPTPSFHSTESSVSFASEVSALSVDSFTESTNPGYHSSGAPPPALNRHTEVQNRPSRGARMPPRPSRSAMLSRSQQYSARGLNGREPVRRTSSDASGSSDTSGPLRMMVSRTEHPPLQPREINESIATSRTEHQPLQPRERNDSIARSPSYRGLPKNNYARPVTPQPRDIATVNVRNNKTPVRQELSSKMGLLFIWKNIPSVMQS